MLINPIVNGTDEDTEYVCVKNLKWRMNLIMHIIEKTNALSKKWVEDILYETNDETIYTKSYWMMLLFSVIHIREKKQRSLVVEAEKRFFEKYILLIEDESRILKLARDARLFDNGTLKVEHNLDAATITEGNELISCRKKKTWLSCNIELCQIYASNSKCVCKNGRAYVCYIHLKNEILYKIFCTNIEKRLLDDSICSIQSKEFMNKYRDMFPDLWIVGRVFAHMLMEESNKCEKSVSSDEKPHQFSIMASKGQDFMVPDIEECSLNRGFPPCIMLLEKAASKRHLKHKERLNYSGFLLDCGFTPVSVIKRMKELYLLTETKMEKSTDTEITTLARRKATCEDGYVTMFGLPCNSLSGNGYIRPKDSNAGCPFKHTRDKSDLIKLLKNELGVTDNSKATEIAAVAKDGMRYSSACSMYMKYYTNFGKKTTVDINGEAFRRPEQYFGLYLDQQLFNKNK
jgi:hypothetical protein